MREYGHGLLQGGQVVISGQVGQAQVFGQGAVLAQQGNGGVNGAGAAALLLQGVLALLQFLLQLLVLLVQLGQFGFALLALFFLRGVVLFQGLVVVASRTIA